MEKSRTCNDCGGDMECGFIPDATYGMFLQTSWHAGEPEQSKFFGMDVGGTHGIKLNNTKTLPITAYRCSGCGLLKFYTETDGD